MLKDINPAPAYPAQITVVGNNVFFLAHAADGGTNLDVKTATGVTVLKDFLPLTGEYGSSYNITEMTAAGSNLYFVAGTAATGRELWVSNGTAAGTHIVKDLNAGPAGSFPQNLTPIGSKLYFTASTPSVVSTGNGSAVFVTNGTSAGTLPLPPVPGNQIPPPPSGSTIGIGATNLIAFKNKLYFMSGTNLDSADGTATGTAVVHQFPAPTSGSSFPVEQTFQMAVVGGNTLYITADNASSMPTLWKSDGTDAGTTALKSFTPKPSNNSYYQPPVFSALTAVGAKLFFTSNDATNGPALWTSDGTANGTQLVKALPTPNSLYQSELINNATVAGSKLYFTTHGATSDSLWVSDGTLGGTVKLAAINSPTPPPSNGEVPQLAAVGGTVLFANYDATHGFELWKTNGTGAGTSILKEIAPGGASSFPTGFVAGAGAVYFSATDGLSSNELWKSTGSAAGTSKVATITPGATQSGVDQYEAENNTAILGNTMLFSANDGVHGYELWKTNGTAAGTVMVKDLVPGTQSSNPFDFTLVNGKVYFVTSASSSTGVSTALWVSNGTAAGTVQLKTFNANIERLTALNGKLVFFAFGGQSGPGSSGGAIWTSNGTAAGTAMVKSFSSLGYLYGSSGLALLNGKLYFAAGDGSHGMQPWVSNGTAAGTTVLTDIGTSPSGSNPRDFVVFKNQVYFTASDGKAGAELWVTGGTAPSTKVVTNLGTGTTSLQDLTVAGNNLYFFAPASTISGETMSLWKTNGTAAGTVKLFSGAGHYIPSPEPVGLPNGDIIFQVGTLAMGGPSQFQPWVSNGTAAGTKLLKSTLTGGFSYRGGVVANGKLYFNASDTAHGSELWATDGTTAGTTLVQDLLPGAGSSNAGPVTILNGHLVIVANDGTHGYQLYIGKNLT
jgi:ELWxxDGT repeat protein